jgi:hypothetical protein
MKQAKGFHSMFDSEKKIFREKLQHWKGLVSESSLPEGVWREFEIQAVVLPTMADHMLAG